MPAADEVGVELLERWLRGFASLIAARRDELTRLDSEIGDADHGTNLDRGMTAVVAALDDASFASPAELLTTVGMTLVSTVGGAGGPLYGTFFLRMASAAGPAGSLDAAAFARCLRAGVEGVVARGKASAGDKTMLDALLPAAEALEATLTARRPLADGLRAARGAATAGRDSTIPMLARKGRASYLGERSIGHQDPGATSAALLVVAAEQAVTAGRAG